MVEGLNDQVLRSFIVLKTFIQSFFGASLLKLLYGGILRPLWDHSTMSRGDISVFFHLNQNIRWLRG